MNIFLLLADSNFDNLCDDSKKYVDTLKAHLKSRYGDSITLYTVDGKYALNDHNNELSILDVDSKNKTAFVQSIENNQGSFDNLIIISNMSTDPYIEGVAEAMTNHHKTIIRYKYLRKEQ